ncbi:MAG: transporter substrate-binding domain-containing protein, partial [Gaiellaceae bacterium]
KQVDFVDYLKVGQSLMVKKGNPEHITGLASLAGKRVSVESGTTNRDFLATASKNLVKAGKKAISIVTFPKDTDAANALRTGRVDAYFGDAPVVAYYIEKTPDAFSLGGTPVNPISIGIAINKSNTELQSAVRKAIAMIYADGTMDTILTKWKLAGAVAKLK